MLFTRLAFHLHPVGLGQLVLGVGDACLQLPIVGQQQQAFAVTVQPARRINSWHVDEVLQGRAPRLVAELGQDVERFVEQDQAWFGRRRLGHAALGGRLASGFGRRSAGSGARG
ncbi:hypothetical protein D3C85_1513960 [compost metagenome]